MKNSITCTNFGNPLLREFFEKRLQREVKQIKVSFFNFRIIQSVFLRHIRIYIHIGIRLDDTKTAPYCSFINSKDKKITKMH